MFRTKAITTAPETQTEAPSAREERCQCVCNSTAWHDDPLIPRTFREGGTFAERKAQAVARPTAPRLISLGPSEHVQRNNQGGYDVVPVELFVDHDRRNDFYVLLPDQDRPIRLNDGDQRRDDVTKLPPLPAGQRRFSKPDTGRPASPSDPPPVRISGENPLFTPNG